MAAARVMNTRTLSSSVMSTRVRPEPRSPTQGLLDQIRDLPLQRQVQGVLEHEETYHARAVDRARRQHLRSELEVGPRVEEALHHEQRRDQRHAEGEGGHVGATDEVSQADSEKATGIVRQKEQAQ